MPRAFSSFSRSGSVPVRASTSVLLPWSMWPAVPTMIERTAVYRPFLRLARSRRPGGAARRAGPARAAAARRGGAVLRRGPRARSSLRTAASTSSIAELDLPAVQVDAHDLDAHRVAEPVDLLGPLAEQHPRLLVEAVEVVGQRRDVDQALDEVLDQLDEQAERRSRR